MEVSSKMQRVPGESVWGKEGQGRSPLSPSVSRQRTLGTGGQRRSGTAGVGPEGMGTQ